jgi:hypothetical protein
MEKTKRRRSEFRHKSGISIQDAAEIEFMATRRVLIDNEVDIELPSDLDDFRRIYTMNQCYAFQDELKTNPSLLDPENVEEFIELLEKNCSVVCMTTTIEVMMEEGAITPELLLDNYRAHTDVDHEILQAEWAILVDFGIDVYKAINGDGRDN